METKNYKYDATIFLPIHVANKKRIRQFNEIGILNCNSRKILLCFLTGTEIKSQEEIEKLFPKYHENSNINLRYLDYRLDHPAAKVYNFYLKKELYENSKWIVKIDDDTSTDIEDMMNFLLCHDQEKEYMFISKWSDGDVEITKELLVKYGLYEKIEFCRNPNGSSIETRLNKKDNLYHEHEILICSNAVINKVCGVHEDIIKERSTIAEGFTDQLFFNLCKIERIYGVPHRLISSEEDVSAYLSRRIFHTHNIRPEIEKIEIIKDHIKSKEKTRESIFNGIEYLLTMKKKDLIKNEVIEVNTYFLKLGEKGNIISEHVPFKFWREEDNKLQFLNEQFKIIIEYNIKDVDFLKQIPRELNEFNTKILCESYLINQSNNTKL